MENQKKKTGLKWLWAVVAVLLVLAATTAILYTQTDLFDRTPVSAGDAVSAADAESFNMSVTIGGSEVIYTGAIEIKPEVSLLDAMKESITDNGGIVDDNGFITSICGHEQNFDTNEYWVYTVNGESLMVSAADYYPENGDEVVFDLSVIVW